jgi:hypothetical protein
MKFIYCKNVIDPRDRWLAFPLDAGILTAFRDISSMKKLHVTQYASVIEYDKNRNIAIKLIQPQRFPRDMLRKYFFSQAKREFKASLRLKTWGLSCPDVFGYGFSLSPFSRYESVLFVEYKNGAVTGQDFLNAQKAPNLRKSFLQNVANDLTVIYKNGWHQKDCRFGNMLAGPQGEVIWIDNDLKRIRNRKATDKYFSQTLKRLQKSAGDSLSNAEMLKIASAIH